MLPVSSPIYTPFNVGPIARAAASPRFSSTDQFQANFSSRSPQFGSRLSSFTELPPVPPPMENRNPDDYSKILPSAQGKWLELRATKKSGREFVHPRNTSRVIHNFIIVRDDDPQQTPYVVLNLNNSSIAGQPKVMLPAGMWGDKDPNEPFEECVRREIWEETGLKNIHVHPLAKGTMFMSSGGVTSERKGFSMCIADGTPNLKNLDAGEKIDRHYLVPLQIFLDRERFAQWIAEITQKGYAVEGDILIARSILDVDWLRQQKLL